MGRSQGEKRSEYSKNIRWHADMYDDPSAPRFGRRHAGGKRTTDQMHMMPERPAWGVYALINPFFFQSTLNVDTTNVWIETNAIGGSGLTVQDERGGVAKFTNDGDDNDYYFYESLYEIAKLEAGKRLFFRGRFKVADVDQADVFFGLCKRIVAKSNLFANRVDAVGFYLADGSASLLAEARKNGTATASSSLATLVDDTFVTVAMNIDGTNRVTLFVDNPNAAQATITTNLPDDEELCFAFGCRNGQAVANSMSVGTTILIQDE